MVIGGGQCVPFDFDINTFEILDPSYEIYEPKKIEHKVEEPTIDISQFEINYDTEEMI